MSKAPEISAIGVVIGLAIAAAPFILPGPAFGEHGYGDGQALLAFPMLGLAIAIPCALFFLWTAIRLLFARSSDNSEY